MDERPRNTRDWYEERDPLSVVDPSLIELIRERAGPRVLDLGCGLGGYSATLNRHGHRCRALDVNPRYVAAARALGVDASVFDGALIPFDDASFDTTIAIEVLEHVPDSSQLLAEIGRVTRGSFIATVPNCTQSFRPANVVFEHMLDTDHKHYFTTDSFAALLRQAFDEVAVAEIVPVNADLASVLLPRGLARAYRFLSRHGVLRPTHYFRLLAVCRAPRARPTAGRAEAAEIE